MAPRPFIPVADTIETQLTFQLGSVYMSNVFYHSNFASSPAPFDEVLMASAMGTWAINYYLPNLGSDLLFVHSRSRLITSSSDPWFTIPYTGYFGGAGDVSMPANVTYRIRGRKQISTKKQRPYICVVGVPRSAVVENEVDTTWASSVRGSLVEVYEPRGMLGYEWAWVSYQDNNSWRTEGLPRFWPSMELTRYVAPRRRRLRNINLLPP